MPIDYDLLIIGGSLAGYHAALAATQFRAKVALVEPQINYELQYHHALGEIAKLVQQSQELANLGIYSPGFSVNGTKSAVNAPSPLITWPKALLYTEKIGTNLEQQYSLANLVAQGVDVILGDGEFQPSRQLAFQVGDRSLFARTYILATGSRSSIPSIEGLQTTGYLTLANIYQAFQQPNPPKDWVILGGVPQSIEIAQILARLGCSVTLIVRQPYLLAEIDPELNQLLIAQLEVDGVKVLTQTQVTQVRSLEDKKWIQAGDKAISTEEILVATGTRPNLELLNLAAAGVKWQQRQLVINQKLQTTNRRIYACGEIVGGYSLPNIAKYEAHIALKNALFFPKFSVNYRSIPWGLNTQPTLAQVGLTETRAKRLFRNNEFLVIKQYFKALPFAQIQGQTTGICKLIVRENGLILGASIFGAGAGELINIIALAMSQNISIDKLNNLYSMDSTYSEILIQSAQDWSQKRLNKNHNYQELLESFFHFRRDWNF
jgi:pyruvate/2-oxoglutarate dehydrogenase complex dihydrolipoamide dehydrogenase (E3) component